MSKSRVTLRYLCMSAVFAALIYIATAYLAPIPVGAGYVHLGDTFIFLCASLLPTPYAVVAAMIGGGLADLFVAPIWAPATLIIKGLTAFCFSAKETRIFCLRNLLAIAAAAVFCVGGYYVWEAVAISSSWVTPAAGLLPNLMQTVVSGILFGIVALVFDRVPALKRFFRA